MVPNTRLQLALWLCGGAGLLLAACQAAPTAPPAVTPVVLATVTLAATSTSVPSTATSVPTDTPVPPGSPTATVTPPPTDTATPPASLTAAPTSTAKPTGLATRPPVTITPLGPPATGSIYSTTGGPAGYSSSIQCQRPSAPCEPVMPPGDISFHLVLASDPAAPWTHFINYGLSVEKDGANVAGLFMFVDAGWLQPGSVVGFGASRTFSQPGTYVIRSSGCMTTDTKSTSCGWATIAGDVVTFVIE